MDLQQFHTLLEKINSPEIHQAELQFNELFDTNKCLLLQLLMNSIIQKPDNTLKTALILLGRVAKKISEELLAIGDESFHLGYQQFLLSLFNIPTNDQSIISIVSDIISLFAMIYKANWPTLLPTIFQVIQSSQRSSSIIAIDCLWRCINSDSVAFAENIPQLMQIVKTIFATPNSFDFHQVLGAARLCYSIYRKTSANQNDEIKAFLIESANFIVTMISNLPPPVIDQYLKVVSFFSDDDIIFLSPAIKLLIPIVRDLITNPQTPELSRNYCINILTQIILNSTLSEEIYPHAIQYYQLFLQIVSNSLNDIDPEDIDFKSNTQSLAEDAIDALSQQFTEIESFQIDVCNIFGLCLQNNDLKYVIANMYCFASAVEGSPQLYSFNSDLDEIVGVYGKCIMDKNENLRWASISSFYTILYNFGFYSNSFLPEAVIPLLATALQNENIPIIATKIIQSIYIYCKNFQKYNDFIPNLMQLLGSKFGQMNAQQQIYTLKCYSILSKKDSNFSQYIPPIYQFLLNVLSDYAQNCTTDLFFACVKTALKFKQITGENFSILAQRILTFILSVDVSQFDGEAIDSINSAIKKIIKRNMNNFTQFFPRIFDIIFSFASKDISCERIPYDNKNFQSNEDCIIIDSVTNEIVIISSSSVQSIIESVRTLSIIIEAAGPSSIGYAEQIQQLIHKLLSQRLSHNLVNPTFDLIDKFINLISQLENKLQIIMPMYCLQLLSFDYLMRGANFDLCLYSFPRLLKVFAFLGQSCPDFTILEKTTTMLINAYQFSAYFRITTKSTDYGDDYVDVDLFVDQLILFFDPYFKFYSSVISDEFNVNLITMFDFTQPQSQIYPKVVFAFWTNYVLYSPRSTPELLSQKINLFQQFLAPEMSIDICMYAISSLATIACSGKLPLDGIANLVAFMDMVVKSRHSFRLNGAIIPQIIILIEKLVTTNQDPSTILQLLVDCVPYSSISRSPLNEAASSSLCKLIQNHQQIFSSIELLTISVLVSISFMNLLKTTHGPMLENYINSIFNSPQGEQVKAGISHIRQIQKS
ncbi:hypothetical protein TRFO_03816 [Tritrichomonas foetus]|uniref:Importin N-terminal domain-containing protein n=1 Tax=Tritrichomonas foetus TaxID=1144522 RepID=A0A1J4KJY4_9EUKA|nr:hypothetical protein TRFO_03816 [Tritrichomonas foetus]|eukprot:OHT11625.1 hypothetical protein TRFO_03816 [Tritrichomonas foetus]